MLTSATENVIPILLLPGVCTSFVFMKDAKREKNVMSGSDTHFPWPHTEQPSSGTSGQSIPTTNAAG